MNFALVKGIEGRVLCDAYIRTALFQYAEICVYEHQFTKEIVCAG
jgi:hypothetical protein